MFINNDDVTAPHRWEWERNDAHFVMLNSNIALVRELSAGLIGDNEGYISGVIRCTIIGSNPFCILHYVSQLSSNGNVSCYISSTNSTATEIMEMAVICLVVLMLDTFDVVAEYKHDNAKFRIDFEAVFSKMFKNGVDMSTGYLSSPCTLPGGSTQAPNAATNPLPIGVTTLTPIKATTSLSTVVPTFLPLSATTLSSTVPVRNLRLPSDLVNAACFDINIVIKGFQSIPYSIILRTPSSGQLIIVLLLFILSAT